MRGNTKAVIGVITATLVLALPLPIWLGVEKMNDSGFTGIQDLPLPGGADLGGHPYTVTAEFADVLSLVPQSAVKVNDVAVGRVTKIKLADGQWTARVTMKVNGKIRLPANSYARIEQSSLLGEKYVQLIAPPANEKAEGTLGGGTIQAAAAHPGGGVDIPLRRTNRNPEVEEVFGALSMLLNGGGVQQLRTITRELNKTLSGREPQIRSMLKRVEKLTSNLDTHKTDITDALDGVNDLSATLAARKTKIGDVLDTLSPGMKVLTKQRGALVTMLKALDKLSGTAVDTIDKSKADMVADLKALAPTLRRLADAGQDLPDSLQVLVTYPFTDQVLTGIKGDYLNAYLTMTAPPGTQIIPPLTYDPSDTKAPLRGPGGGPPLPLPSVSASGAGTPSGSSAGGESSGGESSGGGTAGGESSAPGGGTPSASSPSSPSPSATGGER